MLCSTTHTVCQYCCHGKLGLVSKSGNFNLSFVNTDAYSKITAPASLLGLFNQMDRSNRKIMELRKMETKEVQYSGVMHRQLQSLIHSFH